MVVVMVFVARDLHEIRDLVQGNIAPAPVTARLRTQQKPLPKMVVGEAQA
jgi:hypothetical protein